jgi:hypothetical protein
MTVKTWEANVVVFVEADTEEDARQLAQACVMAPTFEWDSLLLVIEAGE